MIDRLFVFDHRVTFLLIIFLFILSTVHNYSFAFPSPFVVANGWCKNVTTEIAVGVLDKLLFV